MQANDFEKEAEWFLKDLTIFNEKIKSFRWISREDILSEALDLNICFKSTPISNKFKFRLIKDNRVLLNSIVLKFFSNLIRYQPNALEALFILKPPGEANVNTAKIKINFNDWVEDSPRRFQMVASILSEYFDWYNARRDFNEEVFSKFALNLFGALGVFTKQPDYNIYAFEKFFVKFNPKLMDQNKKSYFIGLIFSKMHYRKNYLIGVLKKTRIKNFNLSQFIDGISNESIIDWISNVPDQEFHKWLYKKIGPIPIRKNDVLVFGEVMSFSQNSFLPCNKNYFDFKPLRKDFKGWFINQPRQERNNLFRAFLLAGAPEKPGQEIMVISIKRNLMNLIYEIFDTETAKLMETIPLAYNASIEDNEFDTAIKKCLILGFNFKFFNPFLKEHARSQNISMMRAKELYDENIRSRFGLEMVLSKKIRNK